MTITLTDAEVEILILAIRWKLAEDYITQAEEWDRLSGILDKLEGREKPTPFYAKMPIDP